MAKKKRRADELILEKLNLESLELARALIMEGRALCGTERITSASQKIPEDSALRIKGMLDPYVSRGAHKLKKALDVFHIDINGLCCMDVGASTGGFTDVMLRSGASRVYSIDVGYNLLDYRLRSDSRVTVMERMNARFLKKEDFSPRPVFGATDVSFISLKAVLPAALSVLTEGGRFVALIKPQFEAQKEQVGEKGVVRDFSVHLQVVTDIVRWVEQNTSWHVRGLDYSPITGPEGNVEFLLYLSQEEPAEAGTYPADAIEATIRAAYDNILKLCN